MSSKGILQVGEVRTVIRPYLQVSMTLLLLLGLIGGWAGDQWFTVLIIVAILITSIIIIGRRSRIKGPKPHHVYLTAVINLLAAGIIVAITMGAASPFWLLFVIGTISSSLSLSGRAGEYLDGANVAVAGISMLLPDLVAGELTAPILTTVIMRSVTLFAIGMMIRKVTGWVFEHGGALHESETQLDMLFNQVPAIMWTTDRELIFTSSLGLGLSGLNLEPNQIVGMSLHEFFQTEDESFYPIVAHHEALGGKSVTYELDWANNIYQVHVEPYSNVAGDITGTIGVALDITNPKRVEEAMRHSQKVESLGLLAGGIAHDFNNLLTAMLAQTSLALTKLHQENPARPHVEKAVIAAERAANLTQQLLAYSGRTPMKMRPINLNTLIDQNQHLFEVAIPKTVQLHANLALPLPCIEADIGQMQQIIMNLILNAAEAVGEGHGLVTISTEVVQVDGQNNEVFNLDGHNFGKEVLPSGKYVKLEVRDNGSGMDAETKARIFDPFFTTKSTGRGLGLAVVQGIVHSHRGMLKVESALGWGTTFHLLFPALAPGSSVEGTIVKVDTPRRLKGMVIVIDDEESVRTAVADILELEDVQTLTAANGREGIAMYKERQAEINLVLLDMSMPGMDGVETLRQLQKIDPDVPVLMSSGYSESEISGRFEALGILGFLQKPYEVDQLLEIFSHYLN